MLTRAVRLLKRRIRHSPVFPLLRPRRLHLYCIGAPKTGTVSIANLFSRYQSRHEAVLDVTMDALRAAHEGTASERQLMRMLRQHDRELYLEVESSYPMAVFAPLLVKLFPRARFLLTVRDPRSWLDSIINQHVNFPIHLPPRETQRPIDLIFRDLRTYLFGRFGEEFAPEEEVLREQQLFPLAGYLRGWARHNRSVLDAVPAHRLLVLRTEQLAEQVPRIAAFAGVPAESLDPDQSHSHRAPQKHGLLERIDPDFVAQQITRHCDASMRRLERRISG